MPVPQTFVKQMHYDIIVMPHASILCAGRNIWPTSSCMRKTYARL